jgi:hypothetical protein
MTRQRNCPDETPLPEYQLPLPWEPALAPPQAQARMPTVQAQQVWSGLAPPEQRHLHQVFVRVIQEVLRDAVGH